VPKTILFVSAEELNELKEVISRLDLIDEAIHLRVEKSNSVVVEANNQEKLLQASNPVKSSEPRFLFPAQTKAQPPLFVLTAVEHRSFTDSPSRIEKRGKLAESESMAQRVNPLRTFTKAVGSQCFGRPNRLHRPGHSYRAIVRPHTEITAGSMERKDRIVRQKELREQVEQMSRKVLSNLDC